MISTLPPNIGISMYTLGLVKEISKKCILQFYGFKKLYPKYLYPGDPQTKQKEPNLKNLNLFRFIKWYNPFSWISVGFHINTKVIHAQWWSWVLAPAYLTILSILKIRKKKIVFTVHNVYPHEKSIIKNFLNSCVLKLADEYIVHNKRNIDLFNRLIRNNKPIHIIPHGIVSIKKTNKSLGPLKKKYNLIENLYGDIIHHVILWY